MELVGEAMDLASLPPQNDQLSPDVVVVGCSVGESATAVTVLRNSYPGVPIVFLLGHDEAESIHKLDRQSGIGRITNPFLVADAIRDLCSEHEKNSPRSADLSSREHVVLRQLAAGYTNQQVAGHLGVSVKTVETYRLRMCRKLGLKSRADIVRYAISLGIFPQIESYQPMPETEVRTEAIECVASGKKTNDKR
jgi:two-component system response regulator NreC